jgi:hypothetical protein
MHAHIFSLFHSLAHARALSLTHMHTGGVGGMPAASECAQTGSRDANYDQGEDATGWGNGDSVGEERGKKEEARNVQQSAC